MPQERDNTKAKKPAKEAGEASAPFLSLLGWRMTGESNNASERRDRTSPATWLRPSGSHPGPGPGLRGEGWGGYLFGSSPWPGLQWGSWCSCSWCSCSCSWGSWLLLVVLVLVLLLVLFGRAWSLGCAGHADCLILLRSQTLQKPVCVIIFQAGVEYSTRGHHRP